jgi:hypothetical protein
MRLDEVASTDSWSGTLANDPPVPATLSLGRRFWISPEHVTEFKPAAG